MLTKCLKARSLAYMWLILVCSSSSLYAVGSSTKKVTLISKASNDIHFTSSKPFRNRLEFVRSIYPAAKKAGRSLNVDPKVLVAQAAHETAWGRRVPKLGNGKSSHNLFGMKASSRKNAQKTVVRTQEYKNGKMIRIKAGFRIYQSYEESFQDYVRVLQNSTRYRHALQQSKQPKAFLNGLQKAGYASDPKYAHKIYNVYKSKVIQKLT